MNLKLDKADTKLVVAVLKSVVNEITKEIDSSGLPADHPKFNEHVSLSVAILKLLKKIS